MTEIKVSEYGEIINRCKRSKEEIIADIEKETNTICYINRNSKKSEYIFRNAKRFTNVFEIFYYSYPKLYSYNHFLKTNELKLIVELMEVLENEN